jgi:glycosyltransferase involved in cell wall biosynthesis
MRLLVYDDQVYRRSGGELWTERTLPGFVAGLRERLGPVTLAGRLEEGTAPWHFRLPPEVGFEALPHYPSLAQPGAVLRAFARSCAMFWRALAGSDAVWVFGPHPLSIVFCLLARARGRPVALAVRQELRRYTRSRHPGRRALHLLADALELAWRLLALRLPVIVVGPELAAQYRRSPRLHELHVSLIAAADIAPAEALEERDWDGPLQVLSVGRIDAEKNPLLLADILERLSPPQRWRLVVCGIGPLEAELRARVAERGLGERVRFAGYVPAGPQLMDLYRASHLFLHVSLTEGVPQVLYEAFAAALPVVATAVGGVPAAAGGGAALLVAPADADAAAAALMRVAGDPALRRDLVERGIERVREHTREAETARLAGFLQASLRRA